MSSVNVLHILRTIKERGSVSRTDLQQLTNLSWGTITNTTRELLNRNLIREEGALSTKSGRKPVRLAINPSGHFLVGMDIAPDGMECLVVNLAGEVLWERKVGEVEGRTPEEVLGRAAAILAEALGAPEANGRICLGIGVSLPGALDVKNGVLKFAPRLPLWSNVAVRDYLQERLKTTVRIEHDPNCLAMAERWFGEAGHVENVLCIHLGVGVGMGILLNGEIFRGSEQMAGEFGHTTLDTEGPPCACGDKGCVEAYCSTASVAAYAQSVAADASIAAKLRGFEAVVAEAQKGEGAARQSLERMGRHLGIGLANLVDLFNPDLIVLAGHGTLGAEAFMPTLEAEMARHSWRHSSRQMLISRLGQRGKVLGACGMILQSVFDQDVVAGMMSA